MEEQKAITTPHSRPQPTRSDDAAQVSQEPRPPESIQITIPLSVCSPANNVSSTTIPQESQVSTPPATSPTPPVPDDIVSPDVPCHSHNNNGSSSSVSASHSPPPSLHTILLHTHDPHRRYDLIRNELHHKLLLQKIQPIYRVLHQLLQKSEPQLLELLLDPQILDLAINEIQLRLNRRLYMPPWAQLHQLRLAVDTTLSTPEPPDCNAVLRYNQSLHTALTITPPPARYSSTSSLTRVVFCDDPYITLRYAIFQHQWWYPNLWIMTDAPDYTMCCYFNTVNTHCDNFLTTPHQAGHACDACHQTRPHLIYLLAKHDFAQKIRYIIPHDTHIRTLNTLSKSEMHRIIAKHNTSSSQILTCTYPISTYSCPIPLSVASDARARQLTIDILHRDNPLVSNHLLIKFNTYDTMILDGHSRRYIGEHIQTHILCSFIKRLLHREYSTQYPPCLYINYRHLSLLSKHFNLDLNNATTIQLYLFWIRLCLTSQDQRFAFPFNHWQRAHITVSYRSQPRLYPLANLHPPGIHHRNNTHRIWFTIHEYLSSNNPPDCRDPPQWSESLRKYPLSGSYPRPLSDITLPHYDQHTPARRRRRIMSVRQTDTTPPPPSSQRRGIKRKLHCVERTRAATPPPRRRRPHTSQSQHQPTPHTTQLAQPYSPIPPSTAPSFVQLLPDLNLFSHPTHDSLTALAPAQPPLPPNESPLSFI